MVEEENDSNIFDTKIQLVKPDILAYEKLPHEDGP